MGVSIDDGYYETVAKDTDDKHSGVGDAVDDDHVNRLLDGRIIRFIETVVLVEGAWWSHRRLVSGDRHFR